eukprot:scaffold4913_cov111-Isochrysis_galbana.AAC.2
MAGGGTHTFGRVHAPSLAMLRLREAGDREIQGWQRSSESGPEYGRRQCACGMRGPHYSGPRPKARKRGGILLTA